MVLGEKMAIFVWEWGGFSAPRDGQKISWSSFQKICVGNLKEPRGNTTTTQFIMIRNG